MNIDDRMKELESEVTWKTTHPKWVGKKLKKLYLDEKEDLQMEEINIWWEGPFLISDILENKIEPSIYENTADRIGLYQVYGTHPLYGSDKLLYIGRTKDKRGFQGRLKNRWVIENGCDDENVRIYLGTIFSYDEDIKNQENDFIEKAEVLLINALKPAFNSSNIQSVDKRLIEQEYTIYNHNNYRDIYPILSTKHFWKDTNTNIIITDKLAQEFNNQKVTDENEYYMFTLPKNENIFIGVDYGCWNKTKQPLQLAIDKKNIDDIQMQKIKGEFEILDYSDEYDQCYYISLAKNLQDKNIIEDVKKKIHKIEKLVKCNNTN